MKIARITVTPVKGTALHHPNEVMLEVYGVAENRRFFLVDQQGALLNNSKVPQLMQVRVDYESDREHLSFHFPDGSIAEGSAVAVGDPLVVDMWGHDVPTHLLGGTWTLALSGFLQTPVRLVRTEHYGGGVDEEPLTLVSSESIQELSRQAGLDDVDGRRFRMLLEVSGCEPHEEDTWEGKRLRLGAATIMAGAPVPRCVVTTKDPDTGDKDINVLKLIHDYRGRGAGNTLDFGIYGQVEEPGRVCVGDTVELL